MRTNYKFLTIALMLLSLVSGIFAQSYNVNGDFKVVIDSLQSSVYNDDIKTNFSVEVTNNLDSKQKVNIIKPDFKGWNIEIENPDIVLDAGETRVFDINIGANNNFDYGASVVSPEILIISQKSNYEGTTTFPITIVGENENVSFQYRLNVERRNDEVTYDIEIPAQSISPENSLRFSVNAEEISQSQKVDIELEFGSYIYTYTDTFTPEDDYKIYSQNINSSVLPGIYDAKVTVRFEKEGGFSLEWEEVKQLSVDEYNDLRVQKDIKKGILKDTYYIYLENNGNVDEVYEEEFELNFLQELLVGPNSNFVDTESGIMISEEIKRGETKTLRYYVNYLPIYIILTVIIILVMYIYVRKNSNPLDVETKIYEIKKVKHEGLKSMKVRIGFENIKEKEIDSVSVIFRMPSYLGIKDNSFLLTEPNHVLKGKEQYKLIWDFKKFEMNDSRILGFTLVNTRGILGDIKIPDLEFEVKIGGKIKRYYKSFPTIKG